MLAPNSILQNRYRVVRELGHGGMGTVYEAVDQRVNCVVALKETLAISEGEARRAFQREAELLANLNHPGLPKVMDFFSENEGDFLIMEFIPGDDLAELLASRGSPFPQMDVLRWAEQLLDILEFLHGRGLLHRDIKPSNLKLTKEGRLFLLDFGLAKGATGQMPTRVTSHSVRGYTPIYAPLEQIHGQGTDARSDVYSLGATLYHLLTGVAPIDAPTRFHFTEEEDRDPLPQIRSLNPQVSQTVAGLIHNAMVISRKQRTTTVAEMRTAMRHAVVEEERHNAERLERENAETKRKDDAARRETDERLKREAEEAAAKAAERLRNEQPQKTIPAPPPPPPPLPFPFDRELDGNLREEPAAKMIPRSNRRWYAGAFILGLLLVGIFVAVWYSQKAAVSPTSKVESIPAGMVFVPPGSFMMGSDNGESNEKPVHQVTIKNGFYMGKYEVTQNEWQMVMGSNPSHFKGGDLPVETVSWDDAQEYIKRLNDRHDGFEYRLPTEAEWEYACRAGTTGDYSGDLDAIAWYGNNSGRQYLSEFSKLTAGKTYEALESNGSQTHPVGSKAPNAFGLYDMQGNVFEWCEDRYHESYQGAPTDGSAWEHGDQKERVKRGGAWSSYASYLRSSDRKFSIDSTESNYNYGFRLVAVRAGISAASQSPVIQPSPSQPAPTIIATPTPTASPVSGAISGSVTDTAGAALPGTIVTATRVADSKSYRRSTNDSGRYTLANLPAGVYSVRFEAPNFSAMMYTNVSVSGSATRLNASLRPGSGAETVTVKHR